MRYRLIRKAARDSAALALGLSALTLLPLALPDSSIHDGFVFSGAQALKHRSLDTRIVTGPKDTSHFVESARFGRHRLTAEVYQRDANAWDSGPLKTLARLELGLPLMWLRIDERETGVWRDHGATTIDSHRRTIRCDPWSLGFDLGFIALVYLGITQLIRHSRPRTS